MTVEKCKLMFLSPFASPVRSSIPEDGKINIVCISTGMESNRNSCIIPKSVKGRKRFLKVEKEKTTQKEPNVKLLLIVWSSS